ncbi:MAG: hypothetical protein HOP29_19515 [Phycisphaerales bacterium]|nr:hypothetical protein [Phycisphaerales bacterium]
MRMDAKAFLEGLFDAGSEATPARMPGPASGLLVTTPREYLVPDDVSPEWRKFYEERAAIREFEGGQTREHAEAGAWAETSKLMGFQEMT